MLSEQPHILSRSSYACGLLQDFVGAVYQYTVIRMLSLHYLSVEYAARID